MDKDVFLAAIENDPKDKLTRLMYADWLDEHNQPELAFAYRWAVSKNVYPDHKYGNPMIMWSPNERSFEHYLTQFLFDRLSGKHISWGESYALYYDTSSDAYQDLAQVIRWAKLQLEI